MISISTGKEWVILAGIIAIVGIAALAAFQISGLRVLKSGSKMHGESPEREGRNRKAAGFWGSQLRVNLSCIQG